MPRSITGCGLGQSSTSCAPLPMKLHACAPLSRSKRNNSIDSMLLNRNIIALRNGAPLPHLEKIMRLVILLACSFMAGTASAGCVQLDYQEMKDMNTEDLVSEWCEVRLVLSRNLEDGIDALGQRGPKLDEAAHQDEFDQCMGQSKRIARALETKGIPKKDLLNMCLAKKINPPSPIR